MIKIIFKLIKGWPGLAGSVNLIHPTAQRLTPMGGGLSLYQGVTAMKPTNLNNKGRGLCPYVTQRQGAYACVRADCIPGLEILQ